MTATIRVNVKWMATQFLRDNPNLIDYGETCLGIDDVGYCSDDAAAWGLLLLLRNATKAELVVEGLDEDDEARLIELLRRVLGMDVGP
jgi:hypothetical protein